MKRVYKTSEARKLFVRMLDSVVMTGRMFGVTRYSRLKGAVVPFEVLELLAGCDIDGDTVATLQREARETLIEFDPSYIPKLSRQR